MPPYFGMHLQRKTGCLPENYVAQIYAAIMGFGCPFKSGYGNGFHEVATYEEIVSWNQTKLQQGFKLGRTEHCRNDYMQILFDSQVFSEMRGFWSYDESEISFSLIIPEYDILYCDGNSKEREARISYLRMLGIRIWETGLVNVIQTSLEIDGYYNMDRVLAGENVMTRPFAIIPRDALKHFKNTYFEGMVDVVNNGVLLEKDKDLWNRSLEAAEREYTRYRRSRHF